MDTIETEKNSLSLFMGGIGILLLVFIAVAIFFPQGAFWFFCFSLLYSPFLIAFAVGLSRRKPAEMKNGVPAINMRDAESMQPYGDWADEMVKTDAKRHSRDKDIK